ncbi:MAG TPA: 5'-methylthioadenosine phosphorylase, partial [Actinomycetota bacterium]|nr:5'-methylthioadenosine phosphorylase [Actinomycetota bacterium]
MTADVAGGDVRLGVFGGSGFYSLLDDPQEVEVDTPWGPPSAPVTIGAVEGRKVA